MVGTGNVLGVDGGGLRQIWTSWGSLPCTFCRHVPQRSSDDDKGHSMAELKRAPISGVLPIAEGLEPRRETISGRP
jgi:hypothetical protein